MSKRNRNKKKNDNNIYYYTDGSQINKDTGEKFAAYSFARVIKRQIVYHYLSPIEKHGTNNKMELKAVLFACKDAIETYGENPEQEIIIYTDSAYVSDNVNKKNYTNWLNNGWKNSDNKPVVHKEYWEQLIPFIKNKKIHIRKVRGHGKNIMNTFVNNIAQNASILAAYGR